MPKASSFRSWNERRLAAARFRPRTLRLLLVADRPDPDHDFYSIDEGSRDPLFEQIAAVFFEGDGGGADKETCLAELRKRGIQLIHLRPGGPRDTGDDYGTWLVLRVRELDPQNVLLIGPVVRRAAQRLLAQAELPVHDRAIPDVREEAAFRRELRAAVVAADLEKLIRPLRATKKKPDAVVLPIRGGRAKVARAAPEAGARRRR